MLSTNISRPKYGPKFWVLTSLSDSNQLSSLQVGVGKGRLRCNGHLLACFASDEGVSPKVPTFPLESESGQVGNDLSKPLEQQIHGIPHEDQLCIVCHEAARRSVVNDPGSRWGHSAESVDVLALSLAWGIYNIPINSAIQP
jgi:hypothetical protein